MHENYRTILKDGTAELVEKKSRFIARAIPIDSEESAAAHIEAARKKYWDASHNCYAYQLGERNRIQRQSDDGEPGGTAGIPILDVLRHENVRDTLIIVTRYFGGTLLGTGGLIRAYGQAAKKALLAAEPEEMIFCKVLGISVDYAVSGKVQYLLLQNGHKIADTSYGANVEYIVNAEESRAAALTAAVTDITSAAAVIETLDSMYMDIRTLRSRS